MHVCKRPQLTCCDIPTYLAVPLAEMGQGGPPPLRPLSRRRPRRTGAFVAKGIAPKMHVWGLGHSLNIPSGDGDGRHER